MNSKKKNKHRPKPNPVQKESENVTQEEKIEEKAEILAVEERVPEIISEVPSVEIKDNENEPKKPKRNKGKKKGQEKTDDVEEKEKLTEKPDSDKPQEVVYTEKKGMEPIETKISDVKDIAPAARKKKNKNKKTNEQPEQYLEQMLQETKTEKVSVQEDSSMKPEVTEQESKSAKKKNKKKKNRNDSEKSDRADEELTCTAAFHKLIETAEKSEESKKQTESVSQKENILKVNELIQTIAEKEESLKPETFDEIPQQKDTETWQEPSNRNKKKNKKDKKQPPKTDEQDVTFHCQEQQKIAPSLEETPSNIILKENPIKIEPQVKVPIKEANIPADNMKKDKKKKMPENKLEITTESNVMTIEVKTEGEETVKTIASSEERKKISPKEKAKIAKLVDKKRKGKESQQYDIQESQETPKEVMADAIKEPTSVKDDKIEVVKSCKNQSEERKKIKSDCEPVKEVMGDVVKEPTSLKYDKIEVLKSSEKQSKEERKKIKSVCEPVKEVASKSEQNIEICSVRPQTPLKSVPSDDSDDFVMTPLTEDIETDTTEPKTTKESELSTPKEETQFIPIPEGNKEKKRKKSPIPQQKAEPAKPEAGTEVKETFTTKTESKESIIEMPSLEDIEISSVKTNESEGSISDVTPLVQYPRCSSQQRVDNNNNTEIKEITKEEAKLDIPLDIPVSPFIQGSGETPLLTSVMPSGITITEVKETQAEEKTDLKSKVMEVNQDMEELRLSIERSLAEFTAMEKDEQMTEREKSMTESEMSIKQEEKPCTSKPDDTKLGQSIKEIVTLPPIQETLKEPEASIQAVINVTDTVKEKQPFEIDLPIDTDTPPICPARKDNKGKNKSNKKKGKQPNQTATSDESTVTTESSTTQDSVQSSTDTKDSKTEQKSEQKQDTKNKGKQQSTDVEQDESNKINEGTTDAPNYEPIENFEDAMTSSLDDVNKSFEMIVNESIKSLNNPEISITDAKEDSKEEEDKTKQAKQNPLSQPKNLLGHPDIPVPSNRTDYKKEKNKPPNTRQARVKIKDAVPIEKNKESKECQTENRKRLKDKAVEESVSCMTNENEEYVYKYSFRKVFLPSACQVCKKDLRKLRMACNFCSLVFYCNSKHKDEDWVHHQALCFAVSTIVHLRDQKHIYANSKGITGHNYRLLRMQMIVSCEKVLKRKLMPWEQEALLYPRICGDVDCREWRQEKLIDCEGCGQISYCASNPNHLPKTHNRWCKSYSLYEKLVSYQQTRGRLEPKLPGKVMTGQYQMTEKMNEVLASMYEEKIDMTDVEYAALTQVATAPLTAAYCYQIYANGMNVDRGNKKSFTIHVVGAELQFEADALNKWEIFFVHLRPDLQELNVVLIAPDLNPNNLPLDLLAKVKLCENCYTNKRRVNFSFQDKKTYSEYCASNDFIAPDIVCAFNASIQRSTVYNGKDHWPTTLTSIAKQKAPLVITSYTLSELQRDLARVKEIVEVKAIVEAKHNAFGSVRPDRNFISDDEMPLLFKNYCYAVCV